MQAVHVPGAEHVAQSSTPQSVQTWLTFTVPSGQVAPHVRSMNGLHSLVSTWPDWQTVHVWHVGDPPGGTTKNRPASQASQMLGLGQEPQFAMAPH